MKRYKKTLSAIAIAIALGLAGCSHKLVVAPGQHSVPLYPDEATYKKISQLKQQGGVEGMFGNLGQSLATKQVSDQTPIKILSSDSDGSQVEITAGPLKGQTGFVAKENVD